RLLVFYAYVFLFFFFFFIFVFFFFFQAEDGIRDYKVTGVQTCALPILNGAQHRLHALGRPGDRDAVARVRAVYLGRSSGQPPPRSEERRVGKECRSRWWAEC